MKAPLLPKFLGFFLLASPLAANDWPAYRADGHRSAVTTANLPAKLFPHWTVQSRHSPRTAWPLPGEEAPRMHTDRAYHAVITGTTLVFGNNVDNHVHALDTRTGEVKWSFATEGSVRFAPMIDGERIYLGSDDGYVYCIDVANGALIWKHRMGPSGERIIGRSRMVSVWPVRTGVLVENGVLYAAAGVFPYEGLYIKAIDTKTGKPIWVNDTAGDQAWGMQYGGMAPQGYLVASEDTLFVPAGRSMPAAFDKRTGKFKRFLSGGGKIGGSWAVMDGNKLYAGIGNQGTDTKVEFDAESGRSRGDQFSRYPSIDMVLTKDIAYIATQKAIYAIDRAANRKANSDVPALDKESGALAKTITAIRKRHKAAADKPEELKKLTADLAKATARLTAIAKEKAALNAARVKWDTPREGLGPMALAGGTLFAAGKGFVISIETATGRLVMDHAIKGHAISLAIADDRLFVSTDNGAIHCLSPRAVAAGERVIKALSTAGNVSAKIKAATKSALDLAKVDRGWCLVAGARDGSVAEYLAGQTALNIVVVEHDAKRVKAIRTRLMKAGLNGSRVVVWDAPYSDLPDYFANLIVSERAMLGEELDLPVDELARVLRPSGGQLVLGSVKNWPLASVHKIAAGLKANAQAKTDLVLTNERLHFTRGKLNGAGSWSGLYGNPANTSSTPDTLVKGPLGVLWYGEPGSEDMVDRHARAASPLAINGRLFMQGAEVVMAYDAYNGTFLWKRNIDGAVRVKVDVDGSNITATDDALFVAAYNRVLQLDGQTGKTIREFPVPRKEGGKALRWGYIAVHGNILIGTGATPLDNEYGYLWNSLVKDDKWVPKADVPKRALDTLQKRRSSYEKLTASYVSPDARAFAYFKRAGWHWHPMNENPPNWLPDHNPSPVSDTIMTSEKVFAYDITTGKKLWEHEGKAIPNISVVIGDNRIYFLKDDLNAREDAQAKATTEANISSGTFVVAREEKMLEKDRDYRRVMCLDVKTGGALWSRPYDLTGSGGTKLGLAYQSGKLLAFAHYSNHDERPFSKGQLNWRRITVIDGGGGSLLWSKPLNYRRRPAIVGNTIYIEPLRCDLATGEIQKRKHPITGESVNWEFLRPGHSCGIVTATPNNIFFRSFSGAIVNTKEDTGLQLFGGIRPGCWNSMIPANGLLSMQEASAGCTCSYSLRTTVVLKNKPQKGHAEWAVFISQEATKPVSHLAINFGAPGDMRDREGTVWFGYPRPSTVNGQGSFANYGIKFNLAETGNIEVVQRDWRGVTFAGTDKPWVFTSGLKGVTRLSVPLLEKDAKAKYTVRLGFTPLPNDAVGSRVFDVRLQGKTVLQNFDVAKAAAMGTAVVREIKGVEVTENLLVELTPPGLKGAAAIDVHSKLHHLGDNVVAAWKESSPKPEGFVLTMPFEFKGADETYSLAISQRDVNNGWWVVLNGREIGRLRRDAAEQVVRVPVPKGVLKKGANVLVVRRDEKSTDDIEVGRVQLVAGHPASTVIQSIEIIREDQKTAAKR
ncbi:MAG: PQQ-binding-like beta-propeller repeat protein [Verrucomicrobia subdivision 3 bacterium]|nr:PQQ-binding-like beta-propeller repeat protein [Limisphaerales bacterium]